MVQCFQICRKILCPLDASKFWLVLFESLYWKKSFKLLFRQTGNWNSQIYLRQNYRANFLMMFSWTDMKQFSLMKILCDLVRTLFVEFVVTSGIYFSFATIFSSEWPHSKHANCQYVDSISYFRYYERYWLGEVFDKDGKRTLVY